MFNLFKKVKKGSSAKGKTAEKPAAKTNYSWDIAKESRASKHLKQTDKDIEIIGLAEEQRTIDEAVKHDFPVLIIGETGLGKTYMLQNLARKRDKKLIRVSLNGEVGINELLGKWLIKDSSTYWQDGVLVDAMRQGDWIVFDEINAALPEVLFCLNSLLDDSAGITLAEKDGEFVKASRDFRFFATMNPTDEYAGTKEMNKALLSRFAMVLQFLGYDPKTELSIVKYHSKVDDEIGRVMVDVANDIRKLKEKKEIWYFCSTRDVVNWARVMMCNGNSLENAFELSILNKTLPEERELIIKVAKKASELDVDWNAKRESFTKLTGDLKNDIEKLEKKREKLLGIVDSMGSQVKGLGEEVRVLKGEVNK